MSGKTELDISHLLAARERIRPHVHQTPVQTSASLDALAGARLFFKCENLQRTGSFKYRGATNAVQSLTDEHAARGVATHSSGNHGAALALAARQRHIPAHIVVPRGAVQTKVAAIARYGGEVHVCDDTLDARDARLREVVASTGAHVIHPFNDNRIIAGQGTAAMELLDEHPNLDVIVTPVGGGGLISGSALAARGRGARIEVVGAEPDGADDAAQSIRADTIIDDIEPDTLCDGLRATIGPLTFAVIREFVTDILTADDTQTVNAMREIWHRMKIVAEPSSAVALAIILANQERFADRRVGVVISGGNVDLDNLPWAD